MRLSITLLFLGLTLNCIAQNIFSQGSPNPRYITAPTDQATSVVFSGVTDTQLTVSWTNSTAVNYLLVVGTVSLNIVPLNNVTYTANSAFGSGSALGNGYVCYSGTSNTVTVTGLTASTTYYFQVFGFNFFIPGTEKFITSTATGNPASQTTAVPAATPSTQATSISLLGNHTINWTRGNGSNILVVAKSGSAVNSNPVDNTTYTANATLGSGTQIGTGNYVIYKGIATGFNFNEFSLTNGITYYVQGFEFNGSPGAEKYQTATASGNPFNFTYAAPGPYYMYHQTPMQPRKDNPGYTSSYVTGQTYAINLFADSLYYICYLDGAGHSYTLGADDRMYAMRKLKSDGLPPHLGWSYVDANADGEPDTIFSKSYSTGNTTLGSVIDLGAGTHPRYRGYYGEQTCTVCAAEFGYCETDDLYNWPRANKHVLFSGDKNVHNYFFVSVIKISTTYHFFLCGANASFPSSEARPYSLDYYTSTTGTSGFTLVKRNVLDGLGTGIDTFGAISDFWVDGGGRINFLVQTDHTGPYIGHSSNSGVSMQTTAKYRGVSVKQFSFASFSGSAPYLVGLQDNGTLYKSTEQGELAVNFVLCKLIDTGVDKFTWVETNRWRAQWQLPASSEEFTNSKILTTHSASTNVINAIRGKEVYDSTISAYYRTVNRNVVAPSEVLSGTAGTVRGSPQIVQMAGIFPNSAANYVDFTSPVAVTDTKYFQVKAPFFYATSLTDEWGLVSFTDSTNHDSGFWLRVYKSFFEVTVCGSGGKKKIYRSSSNIGGALISGIDQTIYMDGGFLWSNGTLTVNFDYLNNISVSKIQDDSFTDIFLRGTEKLRIGACPGTTNPYSKYFVKGVLTWNGISNATWNYWIKTELD